MKPETATIITLALLLAASALCVGARHAADRQHASAGAKSGNAGASAFVPEESPKAVKTERIPALPSDPDAMEARLRALLSTSNEADRTRALLELIPTLKDSDWPLVLESFDKIGIVWGSNSHTMVIAAWTDVDTQAAMAWARSRDGGEIYVINAWLAKDPEAALAHLKTLAKDNSQRNLLVVARAMGGLRGDLPRIGEILMAVPEKSGRFLVEQSHPTFSGNSTETLHAWADSFEGTRRDNVMYLLLTNLQGVEAKFALARRFPEDIGPEKYGSIYQEWLNADEAAALKALEDLEPGPLHKSALFGITHGLYMKGRLAEAFALTRRWPEEISQGFLSDILICGDVKDAPLVLAEIPRLKDGPLKVNRYQCALQPWFEADPVAARKWLAENEVPEQVRKEFEGR